ncbi:MAG: hypothetical protein GY754_07290 [bacterium]|nr:hypothetical protein [bacterium]
MLKKYTIEDMQEIAKARGGKCLSEKFIDVVTKLKWECKEGHTWEAIPASVKGGSWCKKCVHNKNKLTIEEMREIAKDRGGKCLSNTYINEKSKLKWECKEGHSWESTPDSVKRGSWCAECAGKKKLTIEEMKRIAKKRGGKCLSGTYISRTSKLKWQCKEGHTWEAVPSNIITGQWCPVCAINKSKMTIEEMRNLAKARGGKCLSKEYITSEVKLKWQCKKGHTWETAPVNVKRGAWCAECAGKKKLTIEEMRRMARKRGGRCLSKEYIDTGTKLKWECKEGHTWETAPSSIRTGTWCPECAWKKSVFNKRILTIEDMQERAKKRGGKCLSRTYTDARTKLKWECSEGHTWETAPMNIQKGSWCTVCAGCIKLTIEEMRSIAKARGGKCLSEEYKDANTKLKWECKEGHTWQAIPANVKRGTWCAVCRHRKKYTIEDMQNIAKERGGKCLSKTYKNIFAKLKWKCKEGHTWEAVPSNIKNGRWCPVCAINKRKLK